METPSRTTERRSDVCGGPEPAGGTDDEATDPGPPRRASIGDRPVPSVDLSRRGFIARSAGLGAVAVGAGIAGCTRGGQAIDDLGDDTSDGGGTPTDDLSLGAGMEIGLGPTAFVGIAGPGEVNPDEPGGGRLLTVDAVEPGERVTFSWRRTVERELTPVTPRTVGVGEDTATPAVEVVEQSGTITATGLAGSHGTLLPMYWRPGERRTDTSAIWLSTEAFRELRETRRTRWSPDVLTRISRLSEDVVQEIDEGVDEVDEVYLHAESDFVDFELAVNGQTRSVRAVDAYDTFGNAYRILDRERNPLILEFTYDAVSTGFAGIDAGVWTLIKTVLSGYQVASIDVA